MRKYHLSEKGPAVCRAQDGNCPLGGEHFDDSVSAGRAYEKIMAKKFGDYGVKKLSSMDPSDIDSRMVEVNDRLNAAVKKVEQAKKRKVNVPESTLQTIAEERSNLRKIEEEYERRGGWSRAFLVTNVGGHVHRNMHCSTTYPTTQFALMTEYSGKSEKDIVDAAGESACTVCYPDAPVSSLRKKRTMLTVDEKKDAEYKERKRREKEELEKKRSEKAVKAKAQELTTSTGEPVVISDPSGQPKTIKSVGTAKKEAEYAMHWLIRRKDNIERGLLGGSPDADELNRSNFTVLVKAVAAREGKDPSTMQERIVKKEAKRYAEAMEAGNMPSPKGLEGPDYVDDLIKSFDRIDFSVDSS